MEMKKNNVCEREEDGKMCFVDYTVKHAVFPERKVLVFGFPEMLYIFLYSSLL